VTNPITGAAHESTIVAGKEASARAGSGSAATAEEEPDRIPHHMIERCKETSPLPVVGVGELSRGRDRMRRFSKLHREAGRLERDLRAERPVPRTDFLVGLAKHVDQSRPRRRSASRIAFALSLVTFVVGTFASFGGVGYAAEGAASAVKVVKKAVADGPRVLSRSSAQQQYGPVEQPGPAEEEAAAAPAAEVAAESLPFTGISLAVTVALGLALLAAGLILRRAERHRS
jgi:hypothetical protein